MKKKKIWYGQGIMVIFIGLLLMFSAKGIAQVLTDEQKADLHKKKEEIKKKVEEKLTSEQKEKLKEVKEEYLNLTSEEKEKIRKQVDKKIDNIEKLTPADKRSLKEVVANAKIRYLSIKKGELIKVENALNVYKNLSAEQQKKLLKYIFEEEDSIKKLD